MAVIRLVAFMSSNSLRLIVLLQPGGWGARRIYIYTVYAPCVRKLGATVRLLFYWSVKHYTAYLCSPVRPNQSIQGLPPSLFSSHFNWLTFFGGLFFHFGNWWTNRPLVRLPRPHFEQFTVHQTTNDTDYPAASLPVARRPVERWADDGWTALRGYRTPRFEQSVSPDEGKSTLPRDFGTDVHLDSRMSRGHCDVTRDNLYANSNNFTGEHY